MDPLRYLLHASVHERLTPDMLWDDFRMLLYMLPGEPIIIGNPLAAGLAIFWGIGVERVKGVIAIGKTQSGLTPPHIFSNSNPYTFMLSRKMGEFAPRPFSLTRLEKHPLGGDAAAMEALFNSSKEPHRYETAVSLTPELLLDRIKWVEENQLL
jgi:hypothetical protein